MRISGQPVAHSYVETHKVKQIQFGVLSPDEIEKMSVVNITEERAYDERGVHPNYFAINDPRMGTMDKALRCYTCKGCKPRRVLTSSPI